MAYGRFNVDRGIEGLPEFDYLIPEQQGAFVMSYFRPKNDRIAQVVLGDEAAMRIIKEGYMEFRRQPTQKPQQRLVDGLDARIRKLA